MYKHLRSIAMIVLYYHLFRTTKAGKKRKLTRAALRRFEMARKVNREIASIDIADADYEMLEFDRYSQSPNDGVAMKFRLGVIKEFLGL